METELERINARMDALLEEQAELHQSIAECRNKLTDLDEVLEDLKEQADLAEAKGTTHD